MDEVQKFQTDIQRIVDGSYQSGKREGVKEFIELLEKQANINESLWDFIYQTKKKLK